MKQRQLNFELLRIYCMSFIVFGHMQGYLGIPLIGGGGICLPDL